MNVGARGFRCRSVLWPGVGHVCIVASPLVQVAQKRRGVFQSAAREKTPLVPRVAPTHSLTKLLLDSETSWWLLTVFNSIFPQRRVSSRDGTPRADCRLVLELICILSLYSNVNKTACGVENLLKEKPFSRYLPTKTKPLTTENTK